MQAPKIWQISWLHPGNYMDMGELWKGNVNRIGRVEYVPLGISCGNS